MSKKRYKYLSAKGKLQYNMTNDYMFRVVLQRDRETLIGLICSVLHLKREEVLNVTIENPITPGKAIDDKEYQLDLYVALNDNTFINLEMQVINYNNWPMRSLAYLCRKFDSIQKGEDYSKIKPVYQIGFLDFNLFDDHPEFFGKYQMRNASDGYLYTDKFNLMVVQLNCIDLATGEDKQYGIDTWAKLFKATSWEEIKMITKENPSMNSAAESIYIYNSDEQVRELCRRREDAIAHEKFQKEMIESITAKNEVLTEENEALTEENKTLTSKLEEASNKNQESFERGKIVTMYEFGMSIVEIAQKLGVTVEFVENVLKDEGML